jgi:hypothetical protein
MTIAKGGASIFHVPRFLGFGRIILCLERAIASIYRLAALHWPNRIYANFVAKNSPRLLKSFADEAQPRS